MGMGMGMELDLYIKRVNVHSDLVVTKNHLIQTLRIFVHEKNYSLPSRAYSQRTSDELKLALKRHPDRDLH